MTAGNRHAVQAATRFLWIRRATEVFIRLNQAGKKKKRDVNQPLLIITDGSTDFDQIYSKSRLICGVLYLLWEPFVNWYSSVLRNMYALYII